jgi:DHA1 family bicyclomycin/chloramphenicol resistance-like MFS transporter
MHATPRGILGGILALLASLVAFGPLAIDLYLPALPAIGLGLGAGPEAVQASISVFLAGFAAGMLVYGPLSDRYGRRIVLLSGIALFTLASAACLLAQGIDQLIAARLFQALGGGAASVLARAVVRDLFAPAEAIRQLSLMAVITTIAPLLAPMAGSVLLVWFGWRGPFGALLVWGMVAFALVWWMLPESLPPERRAAMSTGAAFAAYARLLQSRYALALLATGGMGFAAMFAYITAGPYYFIAYRQLSPEGYSLLFGANVLGITTANYVNSHLAGRFGAVRMAQAGSAVAFFGSLIVLAAVWQQATLPVILGGLFLGVSMTGLMGANCVGLLMSAFPGNAGAAAALFGAAQFGLGMVASFAVNLPLGQPGLAMAATMATVGLLSVVGACFLRPATPEVTA